MSNNINLIKVEVVSTLYICFSDKSSPSYFWKCWGFEGFGQDNVVPYRFYWSVNRSVPGYQVLRAGNITNIESLRYYYYSFKLIKHHPFLRYLKNSKSYKIRYFILNHQEVCWVPVTLIQEVVEEGVKVITRQIKASLV